MKLYVHFMVYLPDIKTTNNLIIFIMFLHLKTQN